MASAAGPQKEPRDWRGIIALVAILGAFVVSLCSVFTGSGPDVPPWIVGLVSAIIAFYYGQQNGYKNGHRDGRNGS